MIRVIGPGLAVSTALFLLPAVALADEPQNPTSQPGDPGKTSTPPSDTAAAKPDEKQKPADSDRQSAPPTDRGNSLTENKDPTKSSSPPSETTKTEDPKPKPEPKKKEHQGSFQFGTYGRVVAAMDAHARPGRDTDVVAHGSRLDEDNYIEAELRREDLWEATGATTKVVITLAIANPIFHWDGNFDIKLAARNLFLEEQDLGLKGLSVWVGSRMLRGDDIYVLDFWPLDNLNTLGAGVGYHKKFGTEEISGMLHAGASRPESPFYHQSVIEPAPLDQFGTVPVDLLDRQKVIGSLRAQYDHHFGDPEKGPSPGIKAVAYGELHTLQSGQREPKPGQIEDLPADGGVVVGAEVAAYTGIRDTYINIFVRYATGLAAYGQFTSLGELNTAKTTDGAHELVVAAGGNVEYGPFGLMLGAYLRSFRDASPALDYEDVDEGIVLVRPTVFFGQIAGLSLEGSYQLAQRGVLSPATADGQTPSGPLLASLVRFGVMPFLSPAGRGNFSRPQIRFIYALTDRNQAARELYPVADDFHRRSIDHFFGIGAEWWFNSSSYGN